MLHRIWLGKNKNLTLSIITTRGTEHSAVTSWTGPTQSRLSSWCEAMLLTSSLLTTSPLMEISSPPLELPTQSYKQKQFYMSKFGVMENLLLFSPSCTEVWAVPRTYVFVPERMTMNIKNKTNKITHLFL